MKNKLNFIILVVISLIFSSCNSSQEGITSFSSNSTQDISITKFYNIGTLDVKETILKVEKNKQLQDTNKKGRIVQAFLMANNSNHIIFLPAKNNINITIANQEIIFNENDYLNKFTQQFIKKIISLIQKQNITKEIIKEIDSEEIAQLKKLELIKKELSDDGYNLLHGVVVGKIAHLKFMLAGKLKESDLNAKYYDFVDSISLDNDQFLGFTDNLNTINELIKVKYYREFNKSFESSENKVEYINKILKNRELASAFTCVYLSNLIPDLSKKDKDAFIETMKSLKLKEKYINHVQTVKPATSLGKVVGSKAEYFDSLVSYNKDFSIEQLKGKTIYVDNWATWCGACLAGINHFNTIYKDINNNKDVVFIFVSFDRKESIWRKYIEKKSLTKKNIIHLYASKGMESEYANYYGVRGLPLSFVIDKDLTIKNSKPPIFEDKNFVSFINGINNIN